MALNVRVDKLLRALVDRHVQLGQNLPHHLRGLVLVGQIYVEHLAAVIRRAAAAAAATARQAHVLHDAEARGTADLRLVDLLRVLLVLAFAHGAELVRVGERAEEA